MSPTSPSSQRPQFTMPLTQIDGPMHLHADKVYYEPTLLVNKLSDQLPPGVDPCQREVGSVTAKSLNQFTWKGGHLD